MSLFRVRGGCPGFHSLGGNMPFLGGRRIATTHGDVYADWLTQRFGGTGDTDYAGYFFRRGAALLAERGTMGFIATNAITDGDNRRTVLAPLVTGEPTFDIHAATTGLPWPGNAQVLVSTVHLARGLAGSVLEPRLLDGRAVASINSRLREGAEWPDPAPLAENAGLALVGCFLRGEGFVLERSEAEAFLAAHPEERDVVRPFLVGDDLSNTPDQAAQRFVIDFGLQCLEEARRHPQALAILSERVRPVRERLKTTGADAEHRKFWWRFANPRRELREKAQSLPRLLATARLSKRPVFAFFPSNWTPSEQVVIFPIASWTAFAVLQSRVHAVWVDLQATHMGEGIRYSATDCFAPFPFPELDPLAILPSLERVGARLYVARAELMARRGHGLTKAYDLLADCRCQDPDVAALRAHHDELEHAVLEAYGWQDLTAPCWGGGPDNAVAVRAFEDAVAGRLFVLNRERATPQRTPTPAGSGVRPRKSRVGPGPKKAAATAPSPRKRKQHA